MKTRTLKMLTVLLTVLMLIAMCSSTVFAADGLKQPNQITANLSGNIGQGANEIVNVGSKIVGILQTVGVVLAVCILIVIGLKYMMGSAEEKAEYKKTMIPYIVGAVLIFAASTLANMIYQFVTGI